MYGLAVQRGSLVLHNFGLCDPSQFEFSRGYIRRKKPPGVGHFYIIGISTLSALLGGDQRKNRQISVRPMSDTFHRGIAFGGKILNMKAVYVPSFKDGISFSSMVYRGAKQVVSSSLLYGTLTFEADPAERNSDGQGDSKHPPPPTVTYPRYKSKYSNTLTAITPPGVDSERSDFIFGYLF